MEDQPQSEHQYILKILSGPHQGAEALLAEGMTVLGSSPECDVVLADAMIAPRHLEFILAGDSIGLEPLEKTYINGKLIKELTEDVKLYQFITLGTTQLVIGASNEVWPEINVADAPPLEIEEEPEGDEAEQAQPEVKEAEAAKTAASDKQAKTQRLFIVAICGLLLLAGIFVALLLFSGGDDEAVDTAKVVAAKSKVAVEAALADQEWANSLSVSVEQGRVVVSGYVETNKERDQLKQLLAAIPDVVVRIDSYEAMVIATQEIFDQLGLALTASYEIPATLVVRGYITSEKLWARAKATVMGDIAGWDDIDDKAFTALQIVKIGNRYLSEAGLGTAIQLVVGRGGYIIASGLLGEEQVAMWYNVKDRIDEEVGVDIPFQEELAMTSPKKLQQKYFDKPISSVNMGKGPGWIMLSDGTKYFAGTSLVSGYTIEKIGEEGVVLRKGNDRVVIKLGKL